MSMAANVRGHRPKKLASRLRLHVPAKH
jgi:hypothetical protein